MIDTRGFTLVETIAAAALGAVTAAMAVPVVAGTLDRERTIIGAQYLAGQLQRARLEALKRGRAVAVRLEVAGERTSIQLFLDDDGDGVRQADIQSGTDRAINPLEHLDDRSRGISLRVNQVITDASGDGELQPGSDPLRIGNTALLAFSPLGSSTSGTLYVAGHGGPQMAIRVFGATGRVRVLTFDSLARKWRH